MPTTRLTANFSHPADNTAYQSGDAIANSATGVVNCFDFEH